jgi:hypothetical protein
MAKKLRAEERDHRGVKVGVVLLDSDQVLTIPEGWIGWLEGVSFPSTVYKGSFVRVVPPKNATDALVAEVERQVRAAGAAAVKVVRARRDETVTSPKDERPGRTAREVVMDMVRESRSVDHAALGEACEKALAGVGL